MKAQRGFSYVEILLSVVLLAVLLVPALEALQSAIAGNANAALVGRHLALQDKMERVLSRPFADLYTADLCPGRQHHDVRERFPVGSCRHAASAAMSCSIATTLRPRLSARPTPGLVFVAVYYENEPADRALTTLVGRWW